jgi:hypothetical protein
MGVNGDKNPLRRRQVVNMLRVNLLAKNWPHELKQVSSLFNLRSANFFYKISLTDSVSYLISGTFYCSTCTKVVLSFLKLTYVVTILFKFAIEVPWPCQMFWICFGAKIYWIWMSNTSYSDKI